MTFKLGLSYLPLARAGLSALQTWSSQLSPSLINPHFTGILPALDDYLKTRGFNGAHKIHANFNYVGANKYIHA